MRKGRKKRKPEESPRDLDEQDMEEPRAQGPVSATWCSVAFVPVGGAEHQDVDLAKQAG